MFKNWKIWHKIVFGIIIIFVLGGMITSEFNFINNLEMVGYWFGFILQIIIPYFILNWLANRKS